ncbi:MAG: hypothetical protein F4169_01420 [Gammaproteobacteria bacterium]|nr:hypothetical protein [Gammaproteobacteria bacterium]MYF27526.1 hypothetical protein [Gammaproteobacteria bacterium]
MMDNPYWTMDNPHGWTSEHLERLDPETQKEVLKAWFFHNFEDPAENTPYESREGGYQYIWGGPYDADEELRSEFEPLGVSDEVIDAVVEEVTRGGMFLWAPTYDRMADKSTSKVDDGWFPLPLDEVEFLRPSKEQASRQNVLERIGALEERLAVLEDNPPIVGSNVPPWTTETPPFSPDEYLLIKQLTKSIRGQAELTEPDCSLLEKEASRLKHVAIGLGQWLKERLDAGADAFMTAIGTAAAVALIGLYEELVQVCQAVVHWITTLV